MSDKDWNDPAEWTPQEAAFGHVRRDHADDVDTDRAREDR